MGKSQEEIRTRQVREKDRINHFNSVLEGKEDGGGRVEGVISENEGTRMNTT